MRFLIVDDRRDRTLLRYLLEYYPQHSIVEASTVKQAEKALRLEEPFDAILMGLHLPNGVGESAFVRLHRNAASTPIVLYSERVTDTEEDLARLVELGAAGYVWKGHADSKTVLAQLVFAAEQARWNTRLEPEEKASLELAENAVQSLKREAMKSDPPARGFFSYLADAQHAQFLGLRQVVAGLAEIRDKVHELMEKDREHDVKDAKLEGELGSTRTKLESLTEEHGTLRNVAMTADQATKTLGAEVTGLSTRVKLIMGLIGAGGLAGGIGFEKFIKVLTVIFGG